MITCSRCGRTNEPHYKFCLGCGVELEAEEPRAPSIPAGPLRQPPPEVLAAGEEEGTHMGLAPQEERAVASLGAVFCRHCGSVVEGGFAFCGACGSRVAGHKPAPDPGERGRTIPAGRSGSTKAMEGGDFAPKRGGRVVGHLVLIDSQGGDGGSLVLRDGDTTVGRALGSHLFESDTYLSPRHATFFTTGGRIYVRDEGSLNGVFLRLRGETTVEAGDQMRLGQELLRYDDLDYGEPPRAEDGTLAMGSPDPGAWGRLVQVVGPSETGDAHLLVDREVVLGRAYGDVLFPDDVFVSGTHCRIASRAGRVALVDLGSSNGTYVRVRGDTVLEEGDLLLLGQQLFQLRAA